MPTELLLPLSMKNRENIYAGEQVLLSGILYTARDAAHKRFIECIEAEKELPIDLNGAVLYYTGPTPPRQDAPIGSAGPTTSYRMDRYTPQLIKHTALAGIIGKGARSESVIDALKAFSCIYFAATGGAGALLGSCIKHSNVVCYKDLGPEAIYKLEVEKFPVTVAIDIQGKNCYKDGPTAWKQE